MNREEQFTKTYYFSEKLLRELGQIPLHPLTVVEAPSGFGKTTAVREYLKKHLPAGAQVFWYTCLGEPALPAWEGICGLLAHADEKTARRLRNIEMPTMNTLVYMKALLRRFHCASETYLVIDNYQLLDCKILYELMSAFSLHGKPNLHMVFITQQLRGRQAASVQNDNIYAIGAAPFFFDREGTARLFRMEGIRLTEEELKSVFSSTEGWVSAIRLQILSYRENGDFTYNAGIERLVETAIYSRLTAEEKEFLLSVSVLVSFTPRQAAIMLGRDALPAGLEELLKSSDFIRYVPGKNVYFMHNILRDYLQNRFYHYRPADFQERFLRLAGRACAAASQYSAAAGLFFKVRDFDALFSLPFTREFFDREKENFHPERIVALVEQCPEETLCRHPDAMLLFGYHLLMHGELEAYRRLCRLLERTVREGMGFSPEKLRKIEGETVLLRSMEGFNDMAKTSAGHLKAWDILGAPSGVIKRDSPWVFGTPSVLGVLWRESGGLDDELQKMDETHPYYLRLTRGHGAGANSVMRAEALLLRGDDGEAEVLCHKALYEAHSFQQTGICLCAELVLARIAILRGDVQLYAASMGSIKRHAAGSSDLYVLRMEDLCVSTVGLMLGETGRIAQWLRDPENIRRVLYAPVIPYALTLYAKVLLLEKRYRELCGFSSSALETAQKAAGNIRYRMPPLYLLLYLAAASWQEGDAGKARAYLRRALDIALPDRVYLPFAQQGGALAPLLTSLPLSAAEKAAAEALAALTERQQKGRETIRKATLAAASPLTPREREVALLARDRMSAREIAGRLYISAGTARNILNSVYSKLGIHSKTELRAKTF